MTLPHSHGLGFWLCSLGGLGTLKALGMKRGDRRLFPELHNNFANYVLQKGFFFLFPLPFPPNLA